MQIEITKTLRTIILLAIFSLPLNTQASSVDPGFDYFSTQRGHVLIDPDGIGPSGPVAVDLMGKPIGGALGNTDTIVERLDVLPPGGSGPIPIRIVELSLRSVAPVSVSGMLWDVDVALSSSIPSMGQYDVNHIDPLGGDFFAIFDVFTDVTMTQVGNPTNNFTLPFAFPGSDTVPTLWSHTAPDLYPAVPPTGFFYPGVDPASGDRLPIFVDGPGLHLELVAASVVPIPAAVWLLGSGLLGLIGFSKRKKTAA